MTPEQIAKDAIEAISMGTYTVLTRRKGIKMPKGFPRGELLCENFDGSKCYRYNPYKIIAWLIKSGYY
jgi:hypothetical protein